MRIAGRPMPPLTLADLQFFDARDDVAVQYRNLPHWSQAGTICFITWRTMDSLPRAVVEPWVRERAAWLRRHDLDPVYPGWRKKLLALPRETQLEYHHQFTSRWNDWLADCGGACV